jgi:peroxiredoxin
MYYGAAAAPSDAYPKRRTRVLDANGAVVLEYNDKIVVGAHPEEVLADVRLMFAKGN